MAGRERAGADDCPSVDGSVGQDVPYQRSGGHGDRRTEKGERRRENGEGRKKLGVKKTRNF